MSSKVVKTVAIVGGGIGGPALALSLLKHGIRSTIYESRPASYKIGGSITLSANANRMLDYLGVYHQFLSLGHVCGESTIFSLRGEKLGSFEVSNAEKYGYPAVIASRNTIRTVLLEECRKQGLSVRYDMRLCTASEDPRNGSATACFESGETANVDLLVGADGMWSRVREAIAPGIKPEFVGQVAIRGVMDLRSSSSIDGKRDIGPNTKIIVGPAERFVTSALDPDCNRVTFHSNFNTHARTNEEWRAFSANQPGMKAMMQQFSEEPWPEYARKLVTETPAENFDCWPFHTVTIPTYVSPHGRICVIGDAAHGLPPVSGQGSGMALEDAATLGLTLSYYNNSLSGASPSLSSASSLTEYLKKWEAIRVARIDRVKERMNTMIKSRKVTGEDEKKKEAMKTALAEDMSWLYRWGLEAFEEELLMALAR